MTSEEIARSLKEQNKDAILLLQAGEYEKAYISFGIYLKKLVDYKLYDYAAKARINMANTLYIMGQYHEALECLKKSLKYFEEQKNFDSLNENRIIEGNLYLKLNELEKLKELSIKMLNSTKSDRITSIAYMFDIYSNAECNKTSIDIINKAITYAERSSDKNVLRQALCLRINYYEKNKKNVYAALDRDRIATL